MLGSGDGPGLPQRPGLRAEPFVTATHGKALHSLLVCKSTIRDPRDVSEPLPSCSASHGTVFWSLNIRRRRPRLEARARRPRRRLCTQVGPARPDGVLRGLYPGAFSTLAASFRLLGQAFCDATGSPTLRPLDVPRHQASGDLPEAPASQPSGTTRGWPRPHGDVGHLPWLPDFHREGCMFNVLSNRSPSAIPATA